MKNITTTTGLREAIVQLEYEKAISGKLMKEQFRIAIEHLKPSNIIKSTFKDLADTPGLKESLFGATMGMASGYLTKKIVVGKSKGIVKNIIGSLLQMGVSTIVSKKPQFVMNAGDKLIHMFKKRSKEN